MGCNISYNVILFIEKVLYVLIECRYQIKRSDVRMSKLPETKRKQFSLPHVFVILVTLVIIVTAMTYFVPAGEFARIKNETTGKKMVDAASFAWVDQNPVSFLKIPVYIVKALAGSSLIWMTIFSAASIEVLLATGAFDAAINIMIHKFKNSEKMLLIATIIIFGIYGMRQNPVSMIGFIPILVLFCRMCGYDALVAAAIIVLGAGGSQSIGPVAPATTAIAQGFADLPIFSGIGFRLILCAIFLCVNGYFIVTYAMRVKKDPKASLVYDLEEEARKNGYDTSIDKECTISKRQIGVLIVFLLSTALQVYGGIKLGWGNTETAVQFVWLAVLGGLVGGLTPSQISKNFSKGASKMMTAAIMIGIATAISSVLKDGKIIDTIVLSIANVLQACPAFLQGPVMFAANLLINIFIPSGSGQAAAVMPLMVPVADLIGMTRQTVVLAFNFGDGLGNYIIPMSSALMANLMAAGVPYERWMKFMGKIFVCWFAISCAGMIIAQLISYGPF